MTMNEIRNANTFAWSTCTDDARGLTYKIVRDKRDGSLMCETEGEPCYFDSIDELVDECPELTTPNEGSWQALDIPAEDWEHFFGAGIAEWLAIRAEA